MMETPRDFTLARSAGQPDERFASREALFARLHALSPECALRLTVANVARPLLPLLVALGAGPCMKVYAVGDAGHEVLLGYVFSPHPNLATQLWNAAARAGALEAA